MENILQIFQILEEKKAFDAHQEKTGSTFLHKSSRLLQRKSERKLSLWPPGMKFSIIVRDHLYA